MTTLHQDGLLDVSFKRSTRGKTVLQHQTQRFPLRMTVPMYLDAHDPSMAFLYVQNPTGAVIAGDHLTTSVKAERGSRVHVTTQSATKLHSMAGGGSCQRMTFRICQDAYLEHIPDMMIPQAGSKLSQRVTVELETGACFIGAETISPGRRLSDEVFEYEQLDFETSVSLNGKLLCLDRLKICPSEGAPRRRGSFGSHAYLVTVLVAAPGRDLPALTSALDSALETMSNASGGAGELPNGAGVIVRILASDSDAADQARRSIWRAARAMLIGLPLPRERK
ncbi:unannotated protein [freshwater metagenome]|uniref:Unannotated protein n=1 Tax=freshwater metagenome TaxID=449393 RepID=A0A6J5ZN23_9ZZZZ|nr:hypothetical protein [Actinomycetota bacterium]